MEEGKELTIKAMVENSGKYDTDDVIQVYIKDLDSKNAVPNHSLCAFKRVSLKKGEKAEILLKVPYEALMAVDEEGKKYVDSSHFVLSVGTSQPDDRSISLTGTEPVKVEIESGSPVQRFIRRRGTAFGRFKNPVKGGKAVEAGLHGYLCDGQIGLQQQPFCVRQPSAYKILIAGNPRKLFEKPGKMIFAEAGHGGQGINAQRFRAVVVDITADGHEFFDVFLLFAGRNIGKFISFRQTLASQSHKKSKKQRMDTGLPERILTCIFCHDFFQVSPKRFPEAVGLPGPY